MHNLLDGMDFRVLDEEFRVFEERFGEASPERRAVFEPGRDPLAHDRLTMWATYCRDWMQECIRELGTRPDVEYVKSLMRETREGIAAEVNASAATMIAAVERSVNEATEAMRSAAARDVNADIARSEANVEQFVRSTLGAEREAVRQEVRVMVDAARAEMNDEVERLRVELEAANTNIRNLYEQG
jgi:hypothetical protein